MSCFISRGWIQASLERCGGRISKVLRRTSSPLAPLFSASILDLVQAQLLVAR